MTEIECRVGEDEVWTCRVAVWEYQNHIYAKRKAYESCADDAPYLNENEIVIRLPDGSSRNARISDMQLFLEPGCITRAVYFRKVLTITVAR